jgi:hypothetical protein
MMKAGARVVINYRGTWNDAQDADNRRNWWVARGPRPGNEIGACACCVPGRGRAT